MNGSGELDSVSGLSNIDILALVKFHIQAAKRPLTETDFCDIATTCGLSRQQIVPFIAEAQKQLEKQSRYAGRKAIEAANKFATATVAAMTSKKAKPPKFNPEAVWMPPTPERYFGEQPGHGDQY